MIVENIDNCLFNIERLDGTLLLTIPKFRVLTLPSNIFHNSYRIKYLIGDVLNEKTK